MKFVLSIHPFLQLTAILLSFYAGYLGIQRGRSLHLGQKVPFARERHIMVGSLALIMLLGGFVGGLVMVARVLKQQFGHGLHLQVGFVILPLLVIGLFTGFFIYLNPKPRKILPAIHGMNNLVILVLALVQVYSGATIYFNLLQ